MPGYIRSTSGTGGWRTVANYFIRTSSGAGGWRNVTDGWIRVSSGAGGWRRFFQSILTPSISEQVTISTSSASFPATLTGTNYNWTNADSLTYVFQKSSDNVSFTDMGFPATIANPAVSNTVTRALTRADFPAYNSYFRFSVTASNTTYSTSATSTSASVAVNKGAPFNTVAPTIAPTSGTAGTTTYSVNSTGTWDPDDSDGIYTYQWQYQGVVGGFNVFLDIPGATSSSFSPASNFLSTYSSPIRCLVIATNSVGSTNGFSNLATVSAPAPVVTPPGVPQNLSRTAGNGRAKTFDWAAPASDGGAAISRYEYSTDGGSTYTSNGTSTSVAITYASAGSRTFHVRAVNSAGAGNAASTSFTIPEITSGPDTLASSITTSAATVTWTSTNQSTYSLSLPGAPATPYTGTTQTLRNVTGLSASTTYTPTLTITSSTSDTHAVTGSSFTTAGAGATAPSNVVVTITSSSGNFIIGDVLTALYTANGTTPFTASYAWVRSTTASSTSAYTAVGSNQNTLVTDSTYNNRYVKCTVTLTNSAGSSSGTSDAYLMTDGSGPI